VWCLYAALEPREVSTMETASELSVRLANASRKKFWNVYSDLEWPEGLQDGSWCMPPELISIYGTDTWKGLDEPTRLRLSFFEVVNFFSLTLQGERPLVQGLCNQMYSRQDPQCTEYIHHFLDEENKHMVMFAEFCNRYAGKVYHYKKVAFPKKYAKGEEDVTFFIKALIVEEIGDVYNVEIERDSRCDPTVRQVNRVHHRDEARHIVFGRLRLREMFAEHSSRWDEQVLSGLRSWLAAYLRSSWGDFYNPTMYTDAGIPDASEVRKAALADPLCREHRQRVSTKIVDYFLDTGILLEAPGL
jgi:hypothetical protein